MGRNLRGVVLAIVAIVGVAGCQERDAPELAAGDVTALRAAFDAYLNAANGGDAELWAALYTEDAVMMPPNGPAVDGRTAIESWLAKLPVKIIDAEGKALEITGAGHIAYVRGSYSMTLQIPGVAQPVTQQGKLLQIYARQPGGSWLLARDIWNADAAPAPQ
jgi:uncharacterized protein (TIGR02246 family)